MYYADVLSDCAGFEGGGRGLFWDPCKQIPFFGVSFPSLPDTPMGFRLVSSASELWGAMLSCQALLKSRGLGTSSHVGPSGVHLSNPVHLL